MSQMKMIKSRVSVWLGLRVNVPEIDEIENKRMGEQATKITKWNHIDGDRRAI